VVYGASQTAASRVSEFAVFSLGPWSRSA